jgi:hypothetical protein
LTARARCWRQSSLRAPFTRWRRPGARLRARCPLLGAGRVASARWRWSSWLGRSPGGHVPARRPADGRRLQQRCARRSWPASQLPCVRRGCSWVAPTRARLRPTCGYAGSSWRTHGLRVLRLTHSAALRRRRCVCDAPAPRLSPLRRGPTPSRPAQLSLGRGGRRTRWRSGAVCGEEVSGRALSTTTLFLRGIVARPPSGARRAQPLYGPRTPRARSLREQRCLLLPRAARRPSASERGASAQPPALYGPRRLAPRAVESRRPLAL